MEMKLEDAIEQLSKYGNGIYRLPDGEERMLYDVINDSAYIEEQHPDSTVLVEWSTQSRVMLTFVNGYGYRQGTCAIVQF